MRCPHCRAALGADASWCGSCFAPAPGGAGLPYVAVPAAPASPPAGFAPPPAGYAAPPAYPVAPAPAPPRPAAPVPFDRYAIPATGEAPAVPHQEPPRPWPMWPTGSQVPHYQPPPPVEPPPRRRAGWTTFAAIAVGGLMSVAFALFADDGENETIVRYSLVAGLVVYGIVAYLVASRVRADDHPLRWLGSWGYRPSILLGLGVGGTMAGLPTLLSIRAGGDGGDPWISVLVSEGTVPHIATVFLLVCVAAPVVEEVLFRGLLLESWLPHGRRLAVWGSAIAFSVWHLSLHGLVYYSVAGTLLAVLYLRKGLACSIAAHAAFNGVLLAASVAYAFAPGPVVEHDGLTLRAPRGWHTEDNGLYGWLHGPSAAEVVLTSIHGTYADVEPAELVARLQLGTLPELAAVETQPDTARTVDLPAGEAVRVRVVADGRSGELVLLPDGERLHVVVLSSGGSTRARSDFDEMLATLRTG